MTSRVDNAQRISAEIDGLDDAQVRALVEAARPIGVGIGGTTKAAEINGTSVFIKQLPVTWEEEADPFATANHNGLPFVSHYGIGSPSHGVGRELAAHHLTTDWVRSGAVDFFPLLLGSRVLDLQCDIDLSEFNGDHARHQWGTYWPQVEKRLAELKFAPTSMVLFLEYVPETLGARLHTSVAAGTGEAAFADAVDQIIEATAWMEVQGLQHFDVHPGNILVHEGRLLFTDFGLSLHPEFDLTPEEEASLAAHAGFDRDAGLMHLFHWVLFELGLTSGPERLKLLRAAAVGASATALDPARAVLGESATLIAHHSKVVVDMTEMFAVLMQDAFGAQYDRRHHLDSHS